MTVQWKRAMVSKDATIRDGFELLDSVGLRILLAVDSEGNLLGTVTDGDIRRGLLSGLAMSEPLSEVMNRNPVKVNDSQNRFFIDRMMQKHGLTAIPIVEHNKVVGLHTAYTDKSRVENSIDNPVLIMAGGFGTRLRPLTDNCPKPMLNVGDKPIVETILVHFINQGFVNFYISTHYMPEIIVNYLGDGERWGVKINYVEEEVPLGTGGALGLLPEQPNDLPLLVINGDILTNVNFANLLRFHNDNLADATMCVREYEYQVPYGVIEGLGDSINKIVEKPVQKFFINAGVYVLNHSLFSQIKPNQKTDMPNIFQQCLDNNGKVLRFPIHEYWLDIGRFEDFQRAQTEVQGLFA